MMNTGFKKNDFNFKTIVTQFKIVIGTEVRKYL